MVTVNRLQIRKIKHLLFNDYVKKFFPENINPYHRSANNEVVLSCELLLGM